MPPPYMFAGAAYSVSQKLSNPASFSAALEPSIPLISTYTATTHIALQSMLFMLYYDSRPDVSLIRGTLSFMERTATAGK